MIRTLDEMDQALRKELKRVRLFPADEMLFDEVGRAMVSSAPLPVEGRVITIPPSVA